MAIRIVIWLAILGGIGGAAYWYLTRETVIEVTAGTVQRGLVEETVAAISSGTVMPTAKAMVAAGSMGKVSVVHVKEGDRVKAGDLIVELEHDTLDSQVTLAKANLAAAQPRLEQARLAAGIQSDLAGTQVSQTKAQHDMAQSDYNRLKALADQQAISKSEMEKATLALRVAQEALNAAGTGQRQDLVRDEDIKVAELTIAQLEAAVAAAESARETAFVKAPIDGVVAKIMLDRGEAVAMGLPLMQLVNDAEIYVEAPFDEANAAKIQVGLPARIEVDSFPDEEFPGEVTYCSPIIAFNKDLSRTLTVKVKVTEHAEKLRPGMSADVTLISQTKDNVVFIPTESLIRDELAYVIENGRAVERPVTIGIGNWEHREILSGLSENEIFIRSVAVKDLKTNVPVKVVEELDVTN